MTQKFFPASQISRNLDPSQKALSSVVGRHDRRLTDADINLIQDLQDSKQKAILDNMVFSGMVSGDSFAIDTEIAGILTIPSFDVLFNGEIVAIGGANSADLSSNRILIPDPSFWAPGKTSPEANIYVVYLELWYRYLDPESGDGYYIDSASQTRFFYPNGCIEADTKAMIPDDVIDPFEGLHTTSRSQIQWAIRLAPLPETYDFNSLRFGLDKGPNVGEVVYGRAFQNSSSVIPGYEFSSLGPVNGDYGLWRAGVGTAMSTLGTLDGYSYAMPVGILFQRNTGNFSFDDNPFGCKDSSIHNSGLLGYGVSGRPDNRFADVLYPEDIIDTRLITSISGEDPEQILQRGFSDLINGDTSLKISRGDGIGCKPIAVGSQLPYTISVAQQSVPNTDYIGAFDGFMNGFSSDEYTCRTTRKITTNMKSVGNQGQRWSKGDSFTISVPRLGAAVDNVVVQVMVNSSPVLLYGQLDRSGIGTSSATITFNTELTGTAFDPANGPLWVTIDISYPSGTKYNLQIVPKSIEGGILSDPAVGDMPVFGVSEYEVSRVQNLVGNTDLITFNPSYSSSNLGTRLRIHLPSSSGFLQTSSLSAITTFIIQSQLVNKFKGVYVVSATNTLTGDAIPIYGRRYTSGNMIVDLQEDFSDLAIMIEFVIQLVYTAQIGYNAPVKGILSVEETVIAGVRVADSSLDPDSRIQILASTQDLLTNQIILSASGALLKGLGGDDLGLKLIFIQDQDGNYIGYPISGIQFFGGLMIINFPVSVVALGSSSWFVVLSILPSLTPDTSLILISRYIPYQGEGVEGRSYSVIHSEANALVTTNGTGSRPVVGIRDVYPFNRELPINVSLPSQSSWKDSDLINQSINVFIDTNYQSKRQNNIEHTVSVPLHTNDFIEPLSGWKRKRLTLSTKGGRGFAKAYPHVGFAIRAPQARNVLGDSVMSTVGPIDLYVNNASGNNGNDGLSKSSAKLSLAAALDSLPPVLRHPVNIYLVATGVPYSILDHQLTGKIKAVVMGEGSVRSVKSYCIYNTSFEIQSAGRLMISKETEASDPVEFTAQGYTPYGDGPTHAFFVDKSRVLFKGLKFTNFVDPAIKMVDANVEFVDCLWENCLQAMSAEDGSTLIVSGGGLNQSVGTFGLILSESSATIADVSLTAAQGTNPFFVADRGSNITFRSSKLSQETNITSDTLVAVARLNSSISCNSDFVSKGKAQVLINSVLTKTSSDPFLGEVSFDSSSSVVIDVS